MNINEPKGPGSQWTRLDAAQQAVERLEQRLQELAGALTVDKLQVHDLQAQLAAAQQTIEAQEQSLQRVDKVLYCKACNGHGVWRDRLTENEWGPPYSCPKCTAPLEQQVAQLRKELEQWKSVASIRNVHTLQTAHTTLRGLVEQLPVAGLPAEHSRPDDFIVTKDGEEWLAHTYNYWAKFATEDEAKAYAGLLQYRATLPREGATSDGGEHE